MVVLHELSHALHHLCFGFKNKEIIRAYKNAKEKKLYNKTKRTREKNWLSPTRSQIT
jgi:hypothetical protein